MSKNNVVFFHEQDGTWYGWDTIAEKSAADRVFRVLKMSDAVTGDGIDDILKKIGYPEYGVTVVSMNTHRKAHSFLPKDGTPVRVKDDR